MYGLETIEVAKVCYMWDVHRITDKRGKRMFGVEFEIMISCKQKYFPNFRGSPLDPPLLLKCGFTRKKYTACVYHVCKKHILVCRNIPLQLPSVTTILNCE